MTEIIGLLGSFLITLSFFPQAIQTIKTKNTDGISLAMYAIFVTGVAIWTFYGFLIGNVIIVVSNSIVLVLAGTILAIKIKNLKPLPKL